jgi:membrane-bound ClpP family serine protease
MPVKFVAYLPPGKALGAATYLALGCSEIVTGPGAALGDFAYLNQQNESDLKVKGETLARLANRNGYPGALFRATIDATVKVYRIEANDRPGEVAYVTEQDWEREQNNVPPRWNEKAILKTLVVKNNGNFVKIQGDMLVTSGVVDRGHDAVDTPRDLYALFNLNPASITVSRDDWLDHIAEFFREPWVRVLLLLIGITGLILEVKMPGVSVPGIIAAVCFVLFFWSYSFVSDYTVLAVLLFVLGLILLGLEIFVFPTFGALGVSGVILLVVSLLLVTLERMPETPEDWEGLGWTLGSYMFSLVGAIVVAVAIASFLPQIPYANRLMLLPPGEEDADHHTLAATEANAALLGAIGIAETPLRPAGKARFADDYVDVISQGDYITPGSRVQVIEIEGNRIVVKQV